MRLWEVETGKEARRYVGHTDEIHCVLFSPDGKLALSASRDTTVLAVAGAEVGRRDGVGGDLIPTCHFYLAATSPSPAVLDNGFSRK